jgi:hypothetical protein
VRGVDAAEEILVIQPMKDTVTGEDIFQEMRHVISKHHLSFDKLHGVSTDGAPAMVVCKTGFVTKIRA